MGEKRSSGLEAVRRITNGPSRHVFPEHTMTCPQSGNSDPSSLTRGGSTFVEDGAHYAWRHRSVDYVNRCIGGLRPG